MSDNSQDVIIERARSLHRVVRALHDGNCPKCGEIFPSEAAQREIDRETCPYCGFYITNEEAKAAMVEFRPVLEKNVAVFEEWRATLRTSADAGKEP